ncbi:MAG: HEAT repeat domain-containing protein [Planctomycetota bacterium]
MSPRGTGPSTGGPNPGGGGRAGHSGARTTDAGDDLTRWEFWWEFNKAPYLALKDSLGRGVVTGSDDFFLGPTRRAEGSDRQRPSDRDVDDGVLPALKRALDAAAPQDVDVVTSCMVAMAKVGHDHPTFHLVDVFEPRLAAGNQEIRESAALALGIAGIADEPVVDLLIGLAHDDARGRRAAGNQAVDERTRTFAVYGLGLVAHANGRLALQRRVFDAVRDLVASPPASTRNLCVAAIHATSLLDLGTEDGDEALRSEAVEHLASYYGKRLGPGDELMQAHCATAIAKLLGRRHTQSARFRELFARDLAVREGKNRRAADTQRACALALGQLGLPIEESSAKDGPEMAVANTLLDAAHQARDVQTRYFALLALGQIGGKRARDLLLREFDTTNGLGQTWAALALGVYAFHLRKNVTDDQRDAAERLIATIAETLEKAFDTERNGSVLGALAIGLGLCKHNAAAPLIEQRLSGLLAQPEVAGYLCIGLALMKERAAIPRLREIVETSTRKPQLLQQAVIALGVLGDRDIAVRLQNLLKADDGNLARFSAIASGLSFIGDRRSIPDLCAMLGEPSLAQLPRAFAAVALGGIADRSPLPWNSAIGVDTNYRASTETLTNQSTGILDIL